MNKIVVVNDKTEDIKLIDLHQFKMEVFEGFFAITNLNLKINKSDDVAIYIMATNHKYKINVDVSAGMRANIYLFEKINDSKVQYCFTLGAKSVINVVHINHDFQTKQMIEANLIGDSSKFNYKIKKVCKEKENSDFYIHHCGNKSISRLSGDIIAYNGNSNIQISTFIEENCFGAKTIQNIHLYNKETGKTDLKPNLYIDNATATTRHHNVILSIKKFDELTFMTSSLKRSLKNDIVHFLNENGGV